MNWIDRTVSDGLSKMHQEALFSNPWARQTARLAVLYGLKDFKGLGKIKRKEAKHVFQKELSEYIANGTIGSVKPAWDADGRESISYHYSRILALTVALEFATENSPKVVAEAIREEVKGLWESYFKWCNHILDVLRPSSM